MLNRRHKALLFITLVITGTALLAGATLSEGLGILILGLAFAWVTGSDTVAKIFSSLGRFPSKSWPWLKVPLVMALGGCVLVVAAVLSNFNSFIVNATLSVLGLAVSPITDLPTQRRWLRVIIWTLGVAAFFFSAVGVSLLSDTAEQHAGRIGELAVFGLISFTLGMSWLIKGWKLILSGINATEPTDATAQADNSGKSKGAFWLYVSLVIGTVLLTLWLGLLAFPAFSDATFAFEAKRNPSSSNPLSPLLALMLLASWPYASWKSILEREPNTTTKYVTRHKVATAVLGGLLTVVVCVAAIFGIQNGNDRMSSSQVEAAQKGFQDIARKIGEIKSRDTRTTQDYIDAYEAIDPLLGEFDAKLQVFINILSVEKERDRTRGPLNVQRLLYGNKSKEWLVWDSNQFELLRQDSELTKKQIQVVRQMAELPEANQVEFWKRNFEPLMEQEEVLREKLSTAKQNMPEKAK